MIRHDSDFIRHWEPSWREYDNEVFSYPNTVGKAGFISYKGTDIVGFGSWDPRQWPTGIIGHNCILPRFRCNGYGKQQISEIIRQFQAAHFTKAIVSTMDHVFFLPACRMYEACGFRETRRYVGPRETLLIEYERILDNLSIEKSR
jgi:GNAT superfamily N-acetyltransferase